LNDIAAAARHDYAMILLAAMNCHLNDIATCT